MRHRIYRFFLLTLATLFGLIALLAALLKHPGTENFFKEKIEEEFSFLKVNRVNVIFPFTFQAKLQDKEEEYDLDFQGKLNPFSLFFGEAAFSHLEIVYTEPEDRYTLSGEASIGLKSLSGKLNLYEKEKFSGRFNLIGSKQDNKYILQNRGTFFGLRNTLQVTFTPLREETQVSFKGSFETNNTFNGELTLQKETPYFEGDLNFHLKKLGSVFEGDLEGVASYSGIPRDFRGDFSIDKGQGRYLLGNYKNIEAKSNFSRSQKRIKGVLALFLRHGGEDFIINTDYIYFKRNLEIENLKAQSESNEIDADLTYDFQDELWFGALSVKTSKLKTLPNVGFGRWKGEGELDLLFAQEEGNQIFSYEGSFAPFSIQAHQADRLRFKGTTSPSRPNHLVELSNYRMPEIQLEELKLEMVTLNENQNNYFLFVKGRKQQPFEITSEGSFSQDPDTLHLALESFKGVWGQTPFELTEPSKASITGAFPYLVASSPSNFTVGEGKAFIELTDDRFSAEVDDVPLSLTQIAFPALPLSGVANGKIYLASREGGPIGNVEVVIKNLRSLEIGRQMAPVNLDLRGMLMEGAPEISLRASQEGTPLVDIKGELPLTSNLEIDPDIPFQFELNAKEGVLPFFNLFLSQENQIRGKASSNLTFKGPLNALVVGGGASLEEGFFTNSFLGTTLDAINFSAYGKDNLLIVENFTAKDRHQGDLSAKAQVKLDEGYSLPLEANLELNNFRIVSRDEAKIAASGTTFFKGSLLYPIVSGELFLTRASFNIPEELPIDVPLVPFTIKSDAKPSESALNERVGLEFNNLKIEGRTPLSVEGRGLTSLWEGGVTVNGPLYSPNFQGKMKLKEGYYIFSGRRFTLDTGNLTFNGLPKQGYLLVSGTTSIRDEIITAKLQGALNDPEVTFSAKSSMELEEVLSYILFEKPIEQITPLEGLQLAQTALSLSDKKGLGFIGKLKNTLGLDLINVYSTQTEGEDSRTNEVSLRAGKYLSKGVFIGVDRNFDTETNSFLLELLLPRHFRLEAEINDDSAGKVELKWKRNY